MAAKVKTEKKQRATRPKQQPLPSMEPVFIPELDHAARIYHNAKTDRVELSKDEDEAKDNLIDKMKENGVAFYESSDGIVVTLTEKSNVKSKKKGDSEDEE